MEEKQIRTNIFYILGIIVVLISVVVLAVILWNNRSKLMTETVVEECLQEYYGTITEEMKILSRSMSGEIDGRLAEIDGRELTDEELQQLLDIVEQELSTAVYNISQDEINKIANMIVKKVLEQKVLYDDELLKQYQNKLDTLAVRTTVLEKKVALIIKNEIV